MYRSKPPTASFGGSERGGVITAPGYALTAANEKAPKRNPFTNRKMEKKRLRSYQGATPRADRSLSRS